MYLELENFKNIEKKIVNIGGRSMIFMGKNGTGKSTLIQAMKSQLDSKVLPSEAIKKGEERARISHKIAGTIHGEYKEYIMDMYFTPGNKSGRLVITNEKGEKIGSPATMIKNIIGNVSFNVTSWMYDKKDKKLETLKRLTGCGDQIDALNAEIKKLKADRKYKKERAESLEGSLTNHGFTKEEINKFSNPIPMEALNADMAQIAEAQSLWDKYNVQLEGFYKIVTDSQANIERADKERLRLAKEIERLKEIMLNEEKIILQEQVNIQNAQENILVGEQWKSGSPRPSVIELTEKIKVATEHNNNNARIGELGFQQKEMINLKAEVEGYKGTIEAKEKQRNTLIANSQLPVEGLSFDDEEIYFNEVPLEEGQQNSALLIDIGIEVAIAMNPNLKVIFIDDGSLYDKDHLKAIVKRIEECGYMAIVELVSEDNEVECVFTEEEL